MNSASSWLGMEKTPCAAPSRNTPTTVSSTRRCSPESGSRRHRLVQRDDGHVGGVVARELEIGEAELDGALVGGQTGRHRGEGLHQRAHGAVGQRLDEVVLVVEVLVEGAGAVAGAARDLAQREVGRAALEQHLASRDQDLVARLAMTAFAAIDEAIGNGAVEPLGEMMVEPVRPMMLCPHRALPAFPRPDPTRRQ